MNKNSEAIQTIATEIKRCVDAIVNNASYDRTVKGRIISHLDGKYYNVQLCNDIYKAYSPSFTYKENDIVYVKIAENNYNNLIIECAVK